MPLTDIDWVFFDAGYTLANEDAAIEDRIAQVQVALKVHGYSVTSDDIREAIWHAARRFSSVAIHQAIADLTGSSELAESVIGKLRWRRELERPYPDAVRVLGELKDRYDIGIIANQSPGTESRLEQWGLLRFVSVCIASAEVGLEKPDLAIFNLALRKVGCEPAQAVLVGDRLDNDIAPAKSLGMTTIRIRQGLFEDQVARSFKERPDHEVRRLDDILHILL